MIGNEFSGSTVYIRKNTLPYIQPYSVILQYSSRNYILGNYKDIQIAETALDEYKIMIKNGVDPRSPKAMEQFNKQTAIGSMEKRMVNPDGDKPVNKGQLKRKIQLNDNKIN
jgi:hypothetical protein